MIIGLSNSKKLAQRIAQKLKKNYFALEKKHFPDGELYIRFRKSVRGNIVVVQSFYPNPQETLVEVVWAAANARALGARKVTLVAPYLGYMRQDKRFHGGEAISAQIMSKLLAKYVDRVLAVDPHLHRIKRLTEVFKQGKALTANKVLADYIGRHFKNEIIIGPDIESYQWAEEIARYLKLHAIVLRKKRYTSRRVKVRFLEKVDFRGKNAVIVDDIISTGHTMIEAVKAVKKLGAKKVSCVTVHGLFAENALAKLKKAGATVIATNTIENSQSKIDVSGLIAEAL